MKTDAALLTRFPLNFSVDAQVNAVIESPLKWMLFALTPSSLKPSIPSIGPRNSAVFWNLASDPNPRLEMSIAQLPISISCSAPGV